MSRLERLVVAMVSVVACVAAMRSRDVKRDARFVVAPARRAAAASAPFHEEEFVSPEGLTPMVHVASVAAGENGRLLATWYGGTKEGAPDTRLFFATRERESRAWSPPRVVASAASAQRELGRHVRKVGNAVLFGRDRNFHLLFVTVAFGGWSGASLNVKSSTDGGDSWSPARRLALSPFFNLSELAKNNPLALTDGSWAVPIYHDLFGTAGEMLRLSLARGGAVAGATKTRLASGPTTSQPALVPLGPKEALALFRDESGEGGMRAARTTDGGASWTVPEKTDLSNPRSGLDAIRLVDGRVLVAFNDGADRSSLSLAVSTDGGRTFSRRALVEREAGQELSYPFLLQTDDDVVHLVYTWKRRRIKHVAFDVAWLDGASVDTKAMR